MLAAGARLAQYEVLDTIGSGGMGVVFRARDTILDRIVALKVLINEPADVAAASLLQEARAASRLNHPNVCTVHEVRQEGDSAFIVMEYVEGKPLNMVIPSDGLPIESALRYGAQMADALAHAHGRGIVHRDLKTANVIVDVNGQIKIVDFGLARHLDLASRDDETRSKRQFEESTHLSGTLAYMAPEVLRGDPPTIASDLWSMGVLLHEMATGRRPFNGRGMFDLTAAILRSTPSPLPAEVPAGVRGVIARCLAKEPEQRYQTAGEVRAALEAVRSGTSDAVPRMPSAMPRRWRGRRYRAVMYASAIATVALLVAINWNRTRTRSKADVASPARLVQIVSSGRQAFDPAISADGTMVAYVGEDEQGQFDVYISRVGIGAHVRITNDAARESHPRFSPDGERIAFSRGHVERSDPEICVMPTFGGPMTVLSQSGSQPAWSPDGQRLAFARVTPNGSRRIISTARVDGSDLRDLVAVDGLSLRAPVWSPDGRSIAFVRGSGGASGQLWIVSTQGGAARQLSNDGASVFSDDPAFSADGTTIVHSSNRGGATNIWSIPVGGGAPTRLTTGPGPDESPTVDARGRVAFMNARWSHQLELHGVSGGPPVDVVRHRHFLWAPAFSPDGRSIAYSRAEVDGSWHVWMVDSDGTSQRRVTNSNEGEIYPRWTPDGAAILYHTWASPHRIGRVDRDGGRQSVVTPTDIDASWGDLSPDGRTLAFVTVDGNRERIQLMSLDDPRKRRPLTAEAGSLPRWSPDGAWIAFARDRGYAGGIFVVRPDGSAFRRISETGGWPVWWPDGRYLAYLAVDGEGHLRVETAAISGAEPVLKLPPIRFGGVNHPIDVSRDGRWIVTGNARHDSSEIWVLDR